MNNTIRKIGFFLKAKLKLETGVAKVERQDKTTRATFNRLRDYESTGEPANYLKLKEFVYSQEFKNRKKEIKSQRFKDTEAFLKLQEYKGLRDSPEIKYYLRFVNSRHYERFKKFENSTELKNFEELREYVQSPEYRIKIKQKFLNSEVSDKTKTELVAEIRAEKQKKLQYKIERKSGKFKGYYILRNAKMYESFKLMENSKELQHFIELEKYIKSAEFREIEKYMKSSDKFERSEEYQKLMEYKKLARMPKIKWYFSQMKSRKFSEVKSYDISFFDDFEGKSLDKNKWITSYYWGNKFLKEGYSVINDAHLLTNGENILIEDSKAKIYTRKEPAVGKAWDPAVGFYPKEFNYTSGIISSGESFRQKYGIFEAKVKLNAHPSVFHSFWMLSDKKLPHIDVFRFTGNSKTNLKMDYFRGNGSPEGGIIAYKASVCGVDFSRGFNIIRLEWNPDKLVWKINNQVIHVQKTNVPQEEMYISFSSGIVGKEAEGLKSVAMEIDWVRCQKLNDSIREE